MKITAEKLDELSDALESAESGYLTERGWKYSCDHPDSCWRWEKKIGSKLYPVSRSEAVSLQREVDAEEALEAIPAYPECAALPACPLPMDCHYFDPDYDPDSPEHCSRKMDDVAALEEKRTRRQAEHHTARGVR